MNFKLLLAQILPIDTPSVSPAIWDFLFVGGIIIGLAIVIFVVTAVARKNRKKRRRKHGPEILRNSEEHIREMKEAEDSGEPVKKRRRKRKRRHEHYQSNPTLAESGGLPPRRDENSAPNTGS